MHCNQQHANFTIHALKSDDEFRRRRPVVHEISHNIYVASTQFERPFDYSTSSWVMNNDCAKNVSKVGLSSSMQLLVYTHRVHHE